MSRFMSDICLEVGFVLLCKSETLMSPPVTSEVCQTMTGAVGSSRQSFYHQVHTLTDTDDCVALHRHTFLLLYSDGCSFTP